MPGKSLKTLADELWNSQGITLIPHFDDGIVPGTVLARQNWNNISRIGHVKSAIKQDLLPPVEGPTPCLIPDFRTTHQMNLSGALALLRPDGNVSGALKSVRDAVASFDSPVTYTMDLLELEDVIESQDASFWTKALGQHLRDSKTRVVFQIIRGRMSFVFRGGKGVGVDLKAGPLGDLASVGLAAGWQWRNEATLESKRELVLAVDYAWYDWGRKRFRQDRR